MLRDARSVSSGMNMTASATLWPRKSKAQMLQCLKIKDGVQLIKYLLATPGP